MVKKLLNNSKNNQKKDKFSWLGAEAPRYTSYPTAHHFSAQVDAAVYRQWLSELADDAAVSLYIHIPFCKELCWFCGCHTKITNHYEPIARYVQVLRQEIALLKQQKGDKWRLTSIHFGGGSPSILSSTDMSAIMSDISQLFAPSDRHTRPVRVSRDKTNDGICCPRSRGKHGMTTTVGTLAEVAIELDPRTTTPENIRLYSELGFNRVSLGIQDFDEQVQIAINRMQPYSMVAAVMQQLRDAGIENINCDLIYGLPRQNMKGFRSTIEKTIALKPSRIALFSYAHVPAVKKHQQLIDVNLLPTDAEKLELFEAACDMLLAAGYIAIGIDHFALPSDSLAIAAENHSMRRNFQGYVSDGAEAIIGLGISAISQFPQGYAQATSNSFDYRNAVSRESLPIVRGYQMSEEDKIRKAIIDELMCFMAAELPDAQHFQREIAELQKPEYQNIVSVCGKRIEITTKHRMAARIVASVFDEYRITTAGRYSKIA